MAVAVSVKTCLEDADCLHTECCAGTPTGNNVCLQYHDVGETCTFRHRNPVIFLKKNFLLLN